MDTDQKVKFIPFSSRTPKVSETKQGKLRVWTLVSESTVGPIPKFSSGLSIISPKSTSSSICGLQNEEYARERAIIVASGGARMISSSDEEFRLEQFDCICIPPRTGYSIENLDSSDLTLAWTVSPSYDIQHPVEMLSSKKLRVIRTLKEIDPIRFSAPGMERSIYNIKETESFHFALFIRGARTFSPLHTHLPKDFEESFTVLNGNLFVTGLEGESYQLHKFDTAYVPAYGGNCNENKSDEFVKYLWTGSPPVDVKEIPVQKEFSKYEKDLAVDK